MALSSESTQLLDISSIKNIPNGRVGIVYTEWNDKFINEQLAGAHRIIDATGNTIVKSVIVPGCFEIPHGCKALYEAYKDSETPIEAIVAYGVVIRGGTPHFEYVSEAVTQGITQLNVTLPIPVIFGVLTLNNEEQAWERLGGIHGHKGEEAMIAALKMIQMKNNLL